VILQHQREPILVAHQFKGPHDPRQLQRTQDLELAPQRRYVSWRGIVCRAGLEQHTVAIALAPTTKDNPLPAAVPRLADFIAREVHRVP
jgi:hypothetical protein